MEGFLLGRLIHVGMKYGRLVKFLGHRHFKAIETQRKAREWWPRKFLSRVYVMALVYYEVIVRGGSTQSRTLVPPFYHNVASAFLLLLFLPKLLSLNTSRSSLVLLFRV